MRPTMTQLTLLPSSRPFATCAAAGGRTRRTARPPPRAGGGCGCGGTSPPSGGCAETGAAVGGSTLPGAASQPAAAEPTTAAALTAFASALGSDGTVARAAMDAIAAPLRREAGGQAGSDQAAQGERVVTVAELLAFDPNDPDNDLDAYIV